ncbi:MAG: glycosyltransferase family 39 protein [Candidatus Bathyarchaeota archaeon]|nr:glycosyltransferase family 39 protein [Candidatus Bathyarchaeota archaeon]
MLRLRNLKKLLSENYPLIAILIGATLISLPMGPYQNTDTQMEYETTQGVLKWGYPYLAVKGNLFDIPPLGFYTAALFFLAFGATMQNGVTMVTLFGLASTITIYKIGKETYGKQTGLFAAALFALSPWQLVLTRAFLVDSQCLFLSLATLYLGIKAIQKDSTKLALASGIAFAAALLTKQYAAFTLIPLSLLYIHHLHTKPKKPRQILHQIAAFTLPAVHANLWWYNIIMHKWLLYFIQHRDFADTNFPGVTPTYTFIITFLNDYAIGIFFTAATAFALIIGLLLRKHLPKHTTLTDIICLTTITTIIAVNMYLGVTLNLKAPYTSAIKYTYQALPYLSLAAASLANKSTSLLKTAKTATKPKKALLYAASILGLLLLTAPIIANMNTARQFTTVNHLTFRVQPNQEVGYTFLVPNPTNPNDLAAALLQLHGAIIALSGLLWTSRPFILNTAKTIIHKIQPKKKNTQHQTQNKNILTQKPGTPLHKATALTLILILTATSTITFLPIKAEPKTITVPDDYTTINDAIANANEGDTILIKKGTYHEQTIEINKPLTIIGENADETTINLNPPLTETTIFHNKLTIPTTAITINANKVKIQNLTINTTKGDYSYGGELTASGDQIEIIGNKIRNCNSLQLNGSRLNLSENSLVGTLMVTGTNQVIAKNTIEGYLETQGSFNTIKSNTVNQNINLKGSFNIVTDNTFQKMSMEHSDSNFISNNSFKQLIIGDYGNSCSNNIISKNKATGPALWGILMSTGRYNVFHDNLITNYTEGYAIAIGGTHLTAEFNTFYRNILVNNSKHVGANWEILGAGNYWDNGDEGNHWDDYTGADRDHNGIGDSPYTIEENRWDESLKQEITVAYVQDNFPLMAPFDISSVKTDFPEWATQLLNHQDSTSESFPILPVAAAWAFAAVLVAGLQIYFKRRKR